jgi:hypothetical protein
VSKAFGVLNVNLAVVGVSLQAAGAALAKLAKAEKVTSAGLALLAPPGDVATTAAKLTTGE